MIGIRAYMCIGLFVKMAIPNSFYPCTRTPLLPTRGRICFLLPLNLSWPHQWPHQWLWPVNGDSGVGWLLGIYLKRLCIFCFFTVLETRHHVKNFNYLARKSSWGDREWPWRMWNHKRKERDLVNSQSFSVSSWVPGLCVKHFGSSNRKWADPANITWSRD